MGLHDRGSHGHGKKMRDKYRWQSRVLHYFRNLRAHELIKIAKYVVKIRKVNTTKSETGKKGHRLGKL